MQERIKQLAGNVKRSPGSTAIGLIVLAAGALETEVDPEVKAYIAGILAGNIDAVATLAALAWKGWVYVAAGGALAFSRFGSSAVDQAAIEEKVQAEVEKRLAANPTQAKD